MVEEAVWDVGTRNMFDPGWWFGFYQWQLQTAIVRKKATAKNTTSLICLQDMAEELFRFWVFGDRMALFNCVQVGGPSRWEDEQSGWEGRVRQKVGGSRRPNED